ncbi:MAG: hypothetical protein LBG15_03875 [Dysgonamonadaceae bacterium]|jgi:hypothetical protein|nr:hypothetical protein [Dysgonamonadaceae bacterium]
MKKIIFFILLFSVFSCHFEKHSPDGDCSSRDSFKFSTTKATVNSAGGKIVITSGEKYWWIESLGFDDKYYPCGACGEEGIVEDISVIKNGEYFSDNTVTQYCGNLSLNPYHLEIIRIETPWFTVIKETLQKLVFDIDPNNSGKNRTLWLGIQAGDCFTGVNIEQTAE